MYGGVKFDETIRAIKVGKVRMEIDSPEVNLTNFENFNYRMDADTNKLVIDTIEPDRKIHAIVYNAPKGSKIISVLPGMIAYRFSLTDDQFSIIGREAPEIFSNKINPLTIIIETEQKSYLKVSFINEPDPEDDSKIIGYQIKKYVVTENDFDINTYIRISNGRKFINRFKFNDDAVIITASEMNNEELTTYLGGHNPERNKIACLPFTKEEINNMNLVLKAIEAYKDRKIIFIGYDYEDVKKLRTYYDCIKTKKTYNTKINRKNPSDIRTISHKK